MKPQPPTRLLDDPALAHELRRDLERTALTQHAYDAAAGFAGLQTAIAALQAAGTSGAAAAAVTEASGGAAQSAGAGAGVSAGQAGAGATVAAATKSALLGTASGKLAIAAAGAALVAAGALAWPKSEPRRAAPDAAPRSAVPAAVQTPAPVVEQVTPQAAAPAASAIDVELAKIRARAERAGHSRADEDLRREIAELGRIKALLDHDPAQAYRLAQAGHRAHVRGMLRHEREGLAVLALWNLDRRSEAMARTRAFLARYPASPLRAELERRLEIARDATRDEAR